MNKPISENRAHVPYLLCKGNSIRAMCRLAGVAKNTVTKLLINGGKACAAYPDEHVRGRTSKRIQVGEIWSFTHCEQKNVTGAKAARRILLMDLAQTDSMT